MGPMLKELFAHPELGLLAAHSSIYWRGVMVTHTGGASITWLLMPRRGTRRICRHGRLLTSAWGQMGALAYGTRLTRLELAGRSVST